MMKLSQSPFRCRGMMWIALTMIAGLVMLGATPVLAGGLSLGWQDCRSQGGAGFTGQLFGCSSSQTDIPLFPALVPEAAIDSVVAVELVIDVDVAADPLPAWWRMDPGQCRANGWAADASLSGGCADPWLGRGVGQVQGWLPGQPGDAARHGRLLVATVAAPGDLISLDAQIAYTLCRVLLRTNNTLTCEGCSTPACLVFNSVVVRRLPGSVPETVVISGAETAGADRVTWQGGSGADCAAVPTRRATWGAIKALYR